MDSDPIVARVTAALAAVPGIVALVLGGSRGRGTETPASDHDFGLYYDAEAPLDIAGLRDAVRSLLDDPAACTITPIGEWGPWINGGGWLSIDGRKVDLLYRDLNRVRAVIDDCRAVRITMDYQPGHPHGFCSSIYAGEIATCRPLSDPRRAVAQLKEQVLPFPAPLREAIVGKFLWEVQFAIDNAALAIKRGEQTHTAGCAYRALCCAAQVLFAINGRYLINEKGALAEAATLQVSVPGLDAAVADIWSAVGDSDFARLLDRLATLSERLRETVSAA